MVLTEIITDLGTTLETQVVEGKFRLVGSVSFKLKNRPETTLDTIYSADYHYNGIGTLTDRESWDLKCIEVEKGGEIAKPMKLDEIGFVLQPLGIQLYDVFHRNLLIRLQRDYPS